LKENNSFVLKDMKKHLSSIIVLIVLIVLILAGCSGQTEEKSYSGQVYLYGEFHGDKEILEREFEIWEEYYRNGMRHLFLETSYFTSEYLNKWMSEEDDKILNEIYSDWGGTQSQNEESIRFFKRIKESCPETVFHGTDIGHQFDSTGERYLRYLESLNPVNSDKLRKTQDSIEQGVKYYQLKKINLSNGNVYRENMMAMNFIRELEDLDNQDIMGIYGRSHTGLDEKDFHNLVPSMANQLSHILTRPIQSIDLTYLARDTVPEKVTEVSINGNEYTASFFGEHDLRGCVDDMESGEYWRLENAYDDFQKYKKTGDFLPYDRYPMRIEVGEVFMIDYIHLDGRLEKMFYISNGREWQNKLATENIFVD